MYLARQTRFRFHPLAVARQCINLEYLEYLQYLGNGSNSKPALNPSYTPKPVFKSLFHLAASFAVFDAYWRSMPKFWQKHVEKTIVFRGTDDGSDGDDARDSFDSIVTPTLRKCLSEWCEINPDTAGALTFLYEGWLVELDMHPYVGALLSDPNLPEGALLWDPVAASLMPEPPYWLYQSE